jgi:hypothetical protein
MLVNDRRKFLRSSAATALSLAVPSDLFAEAASVSAPGSATWDAGGLRHLLPTVSDTRMLIKTSFSTPLMDAPTLSIGRHISSRSHGGYAWRTLALLCI